MAGGSVENRGSGSWRLTVRVGKDKNGQYIRKRKTIKAKNKTEANKRLAEFITEIESGEYIDPSKMLFSDFVDQWRDKYALDNLSPNTIQNYNGHIKTRILPTFGHMKIDEIKPFHVVDFVEELKHDSTMGYGKKRKLSPGTIQYIIRIVKNIFNRAVEWQLIKKNPAAHVKKPKIEQKETNVYDEDEILKLLNALKAEPPRWQVMITLAIITGMRRGELLGLEWDCVDLSAGTIEVKQTLNYVGGKHMLKEPKTEHSKRIISLPPDLLPDLKAYKAMWNKNRMQSAELWEGGEHRFVFTSDFGKPLHPHSVKNWWARFIDRNKLRYIRFHDLRHTAATWLINEGENVKTISSRLGHANVLTTLNIYSHTLRKADEIAATRYSRLFDKQNLNKGMN